MANMLLVQETRCLFRPECHYLPWGYYTQRRKRAHFIPHYGPAVDADRCLQRRSRYNTENRDSDGVYSLVPFGTVGVDQGENY